MSVVSATQVEATVPAGATTGTIAVTTPGGTATSAASFTVVVVPEVTLKLSGLKSGATKIGKRMTANGKVTPISLAGDQVTLTVQMKTGSKWVQAKTFSVLITAPEAYSWKYKLERRGVYRMQATMAESATRAAAMTKWLAFKVKLRAREQWSPRKLRRSRRLPCPPRALHSPCGPLSWNKKIWNDCDALYVNHYHLKPASSGYSWQPGGSSMRYRSALVAISAFLVLVAAAPPALAGSAVTVKGRAYGATRLGLAVQLPNGQRSTVTFTLRKSSGAKLVGYAVGSTRYYENFDFGGYIRVGRSAAYRWFKSAPGSAYPPRARLVYRRFHRSAGTYTILLTVRYEIIAE